MNRIENLDKLLLLEDPTYIIVGIDTLICGYCNYGDNIENLSDPQKTFFYNQSLEREINNGGFNQYFFNSSGDFTNETLLSLKAIGANKTLDILEEAIKQFPNGIVPKNRDERAEILEQIEDEANEIWEKLDQKFFEYEDDLNSLNLDYVKANMELF